jgi:ABC-type dipeptide/oligopeptide/nickel transport system permease component
MVSFIIRRLFLLIPTVFFALSFMFLLFFVLPGDPATLLAGGQGRAISDDTRERIDARYGFDDPILTQFANYWERTVQLDLGESYRTNKSVNDIVADKAPNSIRLAIWALIIEVVVGIAVGLISAIRRYSLTDRFTTLATAGAAAIPAFVMGFVLQYFFGVLPGPNYWDWPEWARFHTSGIGPDTWTFFFIPTGEQWRYLVLPAITLACVTTALLTRMTRGSMLEVLRADYMRTARAKGLRERDVIFRHGLRNAMLPVVTLIGVDFGTAIGVAVLTETTFSWPGLGYEMSRSLLSRDLPVILGLTFVVVLAFSLINLLVDVSYAWFDPRLRVGGEER